MDLQTVFYTIGIIYMLINILFLLGIGIGIYFIARIVLDIRKQIMEKIKYVENIMHHPEETIANIGAMLIKSALRKGRSMLRRRGND